MTTHRGPLGTAELVEVDQQLDGAATTVGTWLLTGAWHPVWPQFILSAVTLTDVEGAPPAVLHFPGATHELMVVALNPGPVGSPPHTAEQFAAGGFRGVGGYLEPIDVVHQLEATDAVVVELLELAARACVDGVLNPSTDDARPQLREAWLSALVRTLAHMRGEAHAR